jgi:hypothetical protein
LPHAVAHLTSALAVSQVEDCLSVAFGASYKAKHQVIYSPTSFNPPSNSPHLYPSPSRPNSSMFVSRAATRASSCLSRQAARRVLPSVGVLARQPVAQQVKRGISSHVASATLATFKIPEVDNEPMVCCVYLLQSCVLGSLYGAVMNVFFL